MAAIAHNVRELRRVTSPGARIMAVVKADGYGHGGAEAARTALANGAEHLGVARLEEGVALRQAGLEAPILIFGHTPPDRTARLLEYGLTQSVFSAETAADCARASVSSTPGSPGAAACASRANARARVGSRTAGPPVMSSQARLLSTWGVRSPCSNAAL